MIATKSAVRTIILREYRPTRLPAMALDQETGMLLWQRYDRERGVLSVEFPTPRTDRSWRLTSRGWAGLIRATPQLTLSLQPRLALADLFGMLQVAHGLQSFHTLPGLVRVSSLSALYDRLASLLASGVLRQARRGLAGGYVARRERLPFVRGRFVPQPVAAPTAPPAVLCDYETWTTDVPDNQILAWTLHTITHAAFCGPEAQAQVRRASRALLGQVSLQPATASDCLDCPYDRLNAAYAPLHAICRFFLAHSAPTHHGGEWAMTSFLVNMPRLYEQFVAETLRRQLPSPWTLRAQETVTLADKSGPALQFTIDLVLYDVGGAPHAVLDTKYRLPHSPQAASVAQVVAYAQAKGCRRAILLYPETLARPLDVTVGDVRVQSMPFGVGERAGRDGLALVELLTTGSG